MAKKGRPPQSRIRQNLVEMLDVIGSAYGYELSKLYNQIFPPASRRVIYYHLNKGCDLGEFEVDRVEQESGDFSWGSVVKKTYYKLGNSAEPRGNPKMKERISKARESLNSSKKE